MAAINQCAVPLNITTARVWREIRRMATCIVNIFNILGRLTAKVFSSSGYILEVSLDQIIRRIPHPSKKHFTNINTFLATKIFVTFKIDVSRGPNLLLAAGSEFRWPAVLIWGANRSE